MSGTQSKLAGMQRSKRTQPIMRKINQSINQSMETQPELT